MLPLRFLEDGAGACTLGVLIAAAILVGRFSALPSFTTLEGRPSGVVVPASRGSTTRDS